MIAQLKKAAEIAQKSLDKPKLALSFNMKVSDTSYDALKEGIEKAEAEAIKAQLEEVGATVVLK